MDFYSQDFDYTSNYHDSSTDPWYAGDNLSECSLLPSPIHDHSLPTSGHPEDWEMFPSSTLDSNTLYDPMSSYQTENWPFANNRSIDRTADLITQPLEENNYGTQNDHLAVTQSLPHQPGSLLPSPPSTTTTEHDFMFGSSVSKGENSHLLSASSPLSDISAGYNDTSATTARQKTSQAAASAQPPDRRQGRRSTKPRAKRRNSNNEHNQVEKKYRTNLNGKIAQLRECIPELKRKEDGSNSDTKVDHISKAMVLGQAADYINRLEKDLKSEKQQLRVLKSIYQIYQPVSAATSQPPL